MYKIKAYFSGWKVVNKVQATEFTKRFSKRIMNKSKVVECMKNHVIGFTEDELRRICNGN